VLESWLYFWAYGGIERVRKLRVSTITVWENFTYIRVGCVVVDTATTILGIEESAPPVFYLRAILIGIVVKIHEVTPELAEQLPVFVPRQVCSPAAARRAVRARKAWEVLWNVHLKYSGVIDLLRPTQ